MEKIDVKYRTWGKGIPPRPIKLEIPGWAGDDKNHGDGSKPQPWHCTPFVDGSTYGLELIYPFYAETVIYKKDGKLMFEGDFSKEPSYNRNKPPFEQFAPGHFGFTSSLDILPPEGYCVRLEPHPRYYTDETGTVPLLVPGHIQRFWPKIFFIVFKSPMEGQKYIFRYGEPYGQILIIPAKVKYNVEPMTFEISSSRDSRDQAITKFAPFIKSRSWQDHLGNVFDDKYKQLATAYAKGGDEGVKKLLSKASDKLLKSRNVIKPKFFQVNYESIQAQKKNDKVEHKNMGCPWLAAQAQAAKEDVFQS